MSGTLHSHYGHHVVFRGVQNGFLYALGILPDGTRREVSTAPAEPTAEAYGAALADLITRNLIPAHDACSKTRVTAWKVSAVAPDSAVTNWYYGEATTTWDLPGGGRAQHTTKVTSDDYLDDTPSYTASHVTFTDLTAEQAVTILRAINTDSRDRRRHAPVHGALARQMREAAPGLRPGDTYHWPSHGGLCTVTLLLDDRLRVDLRYGDNDRPVTLTVYGSMDNQLRAIAAA
jgi:hypothetical protein